MAVATKQSLLGNVCIPYGIRRANTSHYISQRFLSEAETQRQTLYYQTWHVVAVRRSVWWHKPFCLRVDNELWACWRHGCSAVELSSSLPTNLPIPFSNSNKNKKKTFKQRSKVLLMRGWGKQKSTWRTWGFLWVCEADTVSTSETFSTWYEKSNNSKWSCCPSR